MRAARVTGAASALAALLLAGVVAVSIGDPSASRQTAKLTFGKKAPGVGSGVFLDIDYVNPDDAAGKPPAVRRVVVRLAHGGRFDTSVPDLCTASDAELMALGDQACPPASKVGSGVVTVDTGVPGPGRFIVVDVGFFNNTDELIYLNTARGSGARTVIRGKVSSREIVTDVAMLPGTPPDGGSIDTVHIYDPPLIKDGRAYITTPPRCPGSRHWTNRALFTYGDGVTQPVKSRMACKRSGQGRKAR